MKNHTFKKHAIIHEKEQHRWFQLKKMQRNTVKQHEIIRSSTQRMLNKIVVWLGAGTNREPRQHGPWWNLGTRIWLVPFWNMIKWLINTGQWWVALWRCFFFLDLIESGKSQLLFSWLTDSSLADDSTLDIVYILIAVSDSYSTYSTLTAAS